MGSSRLNISQNITDYLRFTRYARWTVIGIVLASLTIIPDLPILPILAIALAATLFTVLCLVGERWHWHLVTNRPLILMVDTVSAVLLVVITGGTTSIFVPLLLFMVVSSAYWYGAAVAIAVTVTEGVLEALGSELIYGTDLPGWPFMIRLIMFATIGLYLSWLTSSERTERNQILAISDEIELQRQQLLSLVNSMSDAVMVSDPDGKIILSNTATSTFIDSAKIVHGSFVDGLMKFTDVDNKPIRIKLKSIGAGLERRDLKLVIPDGSTIGAMIKITPYVVGNKNQGFIFVIRDITREHTIEQERTEFIAVAQHELRTPLTIAEGSLSMVMEPEYQPKDPLAKEMLQTAFRSLRQLSHIVTDLTNMSQAQSERLDPDVDSVDVSSIFEDLVKEHADEAAKKNIALSILVSDKIQPIITSRYLVYEIMSGFMTNALKFTEKGSIELIADPIGVNAGVRLSIRDTGRGISTGDQKKLFGNFFQSENWQTRDHGGTGLGLYISKKLAKRITAEVSFESKLGKGSTFSLELPAFSQHVQDQAKVAKAETKDFFKYL